MMDEILKWILNILSLWTVHEWSHPIFNTVRVKKAAMQVFYYGAYNWTLNILTPRMVLDKVERHYSVSIVIERIFISSASSASFWINQVKLFVWMHNEQHNQNIWEPGCTVKLYENKKKHSHSTSRIWLNTSIASFSIYLNRNQTIQCRHPQTSYS